MEVLNRENQNDIVNFFKNSALLEKFIQSKKDSVSAIKGSRLSLFPQ